MQPPLRPSARRRARGFVLIAALWGGLGLLLAVSTFLALQRGDALGTRAEIDATRAVALARSGINVALADLGRIADEPRFLRRDGTPGTISMFEGEVTIRIFDETGKLDVNAAPIELLRPALIALSEGTATDAFAAGNIAQAIVARRSSDRGPIGGGELRGLLAALGLAPAALARLDEVLTAYNFTPQVNMLTAAPMLLSAIPGMGPGDAEDVVTRRSEGRDIPRLGSAENWLTRREGPAYTIVATARLTGGTTATMRAQVIARGLGFRGGRMRYGILSTEIVR